MTLQRSTDLPARQPGQDGRIGRSQYHPDASRCPTQRANDHFVLEDTYGVHMNEAVLADGGVVVPKSREICFGALDKRGSLENDPNHVRHTYA